MKKFRKEVEHTNGPAQAITARLATKRAQAGIHKAILSMGLSFTQ